jgi:hypothetical protein
VGNSLHTPKEEVHAVGRGLQDEDIAAKRTEAAVQNTSSESVVAGEDSSAKERCLLLTASHNTYFLPLFMVYNFLVSCV